MTSGSETGWRPTAPLEHLRLRAALYRRIRRFFDERGVLEVETPALSAAAATELHLQSLAVRHSNPGPLDGRGLYLHTSPEFPMKRLLAAGSGPIYQLARVFRDGEAGRLHNPEFTLLEWYRPGVGYHGLMDEVAALLDATLGEYRSLASARRLTYREAFLETLGLDPGTTPVSGLVEAGRGHGLVPPEGLDPDDPDPWLQWLLSHLIEPQLGREGPCFLYDYPASQAALARVRPSTPPVAERFELYIQGIELANGFQELVDPAEQRRRFEADNARRVQCGLEPMPVDERLLAALEAGLPDGSGVALGVDRLVMLAAGASSLAEVMAFPAERA